MATCAIDAMGVAVLTGRDGRHRLDRPGQRYPGQDLGASPGPHQSVCRPTYSSSPPAMKVLRDSRVKP
jgi:hypothetical protein